jgi:hypothetical protein
MVIAGKLDELGKGAWIALMIVAFVVFWPAGLALLAFLLISGRIGPMHNRYWTDDMRHEWRARREQMRNEWRAQREEWHNQRRAWKEEMRGKWERAATAGSSSGNAAFDEYKAETLRRLEEEQAEFNAFLEGLRKARDKAEFDDFMNSRRTPSTSPVPERPESSAL